MTRSLLSSWMLTLFLVSALAGQEYCDSAGGEGARPDCIRALWAKADTELNLTYQRVLAATTDTVIRRFLVESELAWAAHMEAESRLVGIFARRNHLNEGIVVERVFREVTVADQARTEFLEKQVLPSVVSLPPVLPSLVERPAANPTEAMLLASIKKDLRDLVTAEEAFFADSLSYTANIGPGGIHFLPSSANVGPKITAVKEGWMATMGNPGTTRTCVIWIGEVPDHPSSTEGSPLCP